MSTVDPTGGGGGGGTSTSVDGNASPGTPSTDIAVPPGSQHQQHPPPSPLSGCYLLVVLPEPHTAQHRDLILNRLAKGFLSWDKDSCHVDLEKELQALVAQAPEGEEARNGERLIQYATENLVTEVLIHPQTNTLLQCIRNLLASFTKHRHIIHAGYTFGGNGSWILQDGTFSLADFLDAFSEHEVQRVLRAYENSVTVDINCAGVGEWSTIRLSKEACTRSCRVRLNPDDVLTAGVPAIASFTNYVGQYLVPQTLDQLMEPSDVVGNIRFSHPTLYVFPGGQGDAALFGINGFNMLVDGGFARKACFWDFARHLDRLDAVLVTRVNNSNVGGMSSVLRKKREMHVYPQIGHFFCNLVERRHSNSPDGDKDLDPLTLNLIDIGQEMMVDLRQINLRAHPCYRDPNPINLYHKVGHGTLDMYVLSPSKDSREVREFLSKWHSADSKLFAGSHKKDSNNLTFPIQNLASICALLVWQPANREDTITRILFPGSTPQHKIFEGFERLKHLDFLKHPVCSAKSLSPSTSLLTLKDRPTIKQKLGLIEKESKKSVEPRREKRDLPESKTSKAAAEDIVSKPSTPQATPVGPIAKAQPPKIDVKTKKVVENKKIETESKKIEKDLKEMKKESTKKDIAKMDKDVETKKSDVMRIKSDSEKPIATKEIKAKAEPKKKDVKDPKLGKVSKPEMPSKPAAKLPDRKPKPPADKKESVKASPPTPKKTMNGLATKAEVAKSTPRPITKPAGKQLPLSTPAKSAKDANNRKVVEQKNIEIASAASGTVPVAAKLAAKPKTAERKPISRRTKPVSPSKARVPGSPAKSTRSTPTTSVKSDKDGVIRKVKGDRGTTDSSTVSTPSGIEIDSMTKLADKSLTEKSEDMSLDSIESKVLADLKEEREVVEEIEAVLQKAERIEEARKDDHLDGDDDITAEATDKKEDDMTEDDVTADIEEAPKKKTSRKASQELTEEDEYLIVEKEEIYIEDSAQSGEGEQKHVLDAVESEKMKPEHDVETAKEDEEAEISEEKEKSDVPEKKLPYYDGVADKEKEADEMSPGHKEQLKEEMKDIIASATEIVQKVEDKDDSGKKDSEDITKEPSSLSPDKFDSSEKKTTDTDPMKPEVDQKDQQIVEKMEESQERISTLESGATTTAPTLPEDERIPLDDIKEVIDEKYIADDDKEKEKENVEQVKESFVPPIPTEPKPDAKSFQVRPALQGIQREIVKTPDEVADLPVHEEVDPKLYRMEDFEKAKEEKPIVPSTPQQPETKEPPTPPVKEQKGVFSFFGKVAGKFEKGMDKLTGKSRRDSEKDVDEKSSSKSSSPKEVKPQDITLPGDVRADEVTEALAKAVKLPEISESFEKGEPEISKVKVAAITDTAAFLQREIEDLTKSPHPDQETKDTVEDVKSVKPEAKVESKPVISEEPVFETCVLKGQQKDILAGPVADIDEDVEDVEALLEEASKKFKTVKDSLRDSLESLEEKIVEEEMVRAELAAASKDVVKDTLSEVVEKLEEIKPHMEEVATSDTKEPEKVKFQVAKADLDVEESISDESEVTKDFKEAVRDVGEVLAGSAGILIEEKPKDVIEIVKKVAEELKKDDFLSHDLLFDKDGVQQADERASDEEIKSVKPVIEEIIPKKVGITEELPPQEEIEELLDSTLATKPLESYKPADVPEVQEEPCTKTIASGGMDLASPIRDSAADKIDAMKICSDLMEEDPVPSRHKRSICDEDETKVDVMEAGVESVCIKKIVTSKQDDENREIQGSDIVFDRKLSPDKAQMVIVTPDSAPTSPQFPGAKMEHAKEGIDEITQLPYDVKNELDKQGTLEEIIEHLVFSKKTKITIQIVEYITVTRKIPRERVVYIIEEIIIKKGVPRDSVVADLDLLKPDSVSSEKRAEIEQYIDQEYITKNKRITIDIVEEIAIKKFVTKRIVIEIIEEIIVKKKIPRDSVLDISEEEMAHLRGQSEETMSEQEPVSKRGSVIDLQIDQAPKPDISSTDVRSEIEKYIVDDIISKGRKITLHTIDEIASAKQVPRRLFIEILEEIIIQRKIPRTSILDMSEKELTDLIMSEKEDMDREEQISEMDQSSVSSETRLQIEKNIIDEYITKNRRITPHAFEEICVSSKVPRLIIIQIIEEIVVKRKVPRSSILDVTDIELEELLSADKEEDEKESVAPASEIEDRKHLESETEEYKSVTAEKIAEIENSVIEEYISKSRRITPYIFEDICIRYKIPRRILIEIIEEIIIKRNVRRGSILDITDVELSELLVAAEAGDEEEELDVEPDVEQDVMPDDAGEDKLVDGFVSIPGKDIAPTTAALTTKAVELAEPALKESEKDVTDDFEAVEQEYKIHGTAITTTRQSISLAPGTKLDEGKLTDDMEEAIEDDVSDVVEADEKTIDVVVPVTTSTTEKKYDDVSETSEVVDTTEKYLIEAQEKAELRHEQDIVSDTHKTDTTGRRDSAAIDKTAQMHADGVTEAGMPSTARPQERKASEVKELDDKDVPEIEDKTEVTRPKRSIDEISRKDSLALQEHVEVVSTSKAESPDKKKIDDIADDDETIAPTGTVRRMLVTASSEDGGQETVVCPTGSITFTTSITPEDSLKSSPVKTTPDQDSLLLEKESLRSGASTPEKDSISGKSTPGTKDGDKITPEDSLDKSPLGTRDSQDLEDSLDKSDPTKLKETEKPKSLTKTEEEKESSSHAITDDKPIEPVKSSRKPSVVGDTITEKDLKAMVDATLTTVGEKVDDKVISKSPSVAGERLDEMDLSVVEKSRSPSVASETRAEVEPAERSKSPSVVGDIIAKTSIDGEKMDEKASFEQSKPSGTAEDKFSEKDASELDDKSRSPSIASEKLDDKEATVKSGTSSTAGDKITEKDLKEIVDGIKSPEALTETIDDKMLLDRSKSPSVTGDKSSEKGLSEADEKSRSPSIASEKHDDRESIVRSGTPSIAGDKITEKDLEEIVDEIKSSTALTETIDDKMFVDRSKSPSVASDKSSQKGASEADEKSRSPSIVSEKHDDRESAVKSGTPSIAGDKITEKDLKEIVDEIKSSDAPTESRDDKMSVDRSKSPSIAGDKLSEKEASEKDEKSRSPSIASEKPDDKETILKSGTPSIAGDKITEKELKEIVDEIKSVSALTETIDDKMSVDRSKSPSIAGDKLSEKEASEKDEKSRSPSIASDKPDDKETTLKSGTPSIAGDKITEKDLKEVVDEIKSSDALTETIDDKMSGDSSKSPSIAGDKLSEKQDSEKDEKSRSPSIASEKHDDKEATAKSGTPSIASEKDEKSRSPSIASDKPDDKETTLKSGTPSIAGDKITEKDLEEMVEESAAHDAITETIDGRVLVDRSKSPSIAGDKQSEKGASEKHDKSRSPSIASEIHDDREPTVKSGTSSIAGDKITEKDLKEIIDDSKSPDGVTETKDDKVLIDRSKSPSIAGDKLSEKEASEKDEKSRSPSIASDKPDDKETTLMSGTPSIAGDKITEKDIKEIVDEIKSSDAVTETVDNKMLVDRSKSPSIAGDKLSEKEASEVDEKSRSPSIASEKPDDKETTLKSGTPSIAGDKITEKDIKELVDEIKSVDALAETMDDKMSVDRSKSPSIAGDKLSEKEASEKDEKSRSPSFASEKPDDKETTLKSGTPSIAGDKLSEKEASEKDVKSRSPSIASEKPDDKETILKSGTPSIAGDKITEKDIKEIVDEIKSVDALTETKDDKMSVDNSKSPSIAGDKLSEKETSEKDEKSRSPSIASEKHDDKEPTVMSRTPSLAGDKITEKDLKEIVDEPTAHDVLVDRSKSPSIAGDKPSEKETSEADKKSRSPSIASEKHDDSQPIVKSGTPSIAGDKITEKDLKEIVDEMKSSDALTETIDDKMSDDRSNSPSIAGDKLSDKEASEKDEKSRSPSIASEKPDDKETILKSGTPSIAGDKITEKDLKEMVDEIKSVDALTETIDNKMSVDRSKSPSIAGDKLSEKEPSETDEKSRSPSIASEKPDDKETILKSGTPSIAGDKITEKDLKEIVDEIKSVDALTETIDDKMSVDRSKSPSIAGDKLSEKETSEKDEKSRSPSIASEKDDHKEPTVKSGTPSIAGDKITDKDLKEIVDESELHDTATETVDDKVLIDRSKSPSIAGDKLSEKETSEADEKSRSPSIVSEKHDREPTVKSGTPSIADDKITEKDLKEIVDAIESPDALTETIDHKMVADRSKSPSISGDKPSEKEPSVADGKSRSPSIISEIHDDREPTVKSGASSVVGDKITEKDLKEIVDEIKSSDALTETKDDKVLIDRSKSPSITGDKLSEKAASETDEKSRSPSIASEKHDDMEPTVKSGTPSIAGDKITEKDLKEIIDDITSPDAVTKTIDDKVLVDRSKSPSIAGDTSSEKGASDGVEKSRTPSIVSEKRDDREIIAKSGTPSIAGDKITEKDLKEIVDEIDRSKSPSIAGDKSSEKETSEADKKSRSPSIASEKHDDDQPIVKSGTPSIAGDKITEKDLKEIVDEIKLPDAITERIDRKMSVELSKSPNISSDKPSEKESSQVDEKSRSPSIASEKHDDREPTVKSGTPSIAGDKITEKDLKDIIGETTSPDAVTETIDDKILGDRSKSPSIAGDKLSEKGALEADEKSRSPSIASEKHDDKEPAVKSRTPSLAGDKITEKDLKEIIDASKLPGVLSESTAGKASADGSKSPNFGDKQSEKGASEKDDKSRSPSIASEIHDDRDPTVKSGTSSIAGDKITEKDLKEIIDDSKSPDGVTETKDDKVLIDRAKSPSITGDKLSEKATSEADEKSRSPSIASEKHDDKETIVTSETSSIAGSKISEKDLKEIIDESQLPDALTDITDGKVLVDRSKSPSIAGDEHSEKVPIEADKKSRSPSISSEKHDDKELTATSRTSSIVGDKIITEKDLKEIVDEIKLPSSSSDTVEDKASIDRSKSPSVAGDKHSATGVSEADEKSRSPSITSDKHDDKELIAKSGASSVAGEKITEEDLKELIDEFKPLGAPSEKVDEKGTVDRSKSPSVASDKHSEKDSSELDEKSRSPSITSEKHDDKDTASRSRSASVTADKIDEKNLKSPSAASEKIDEKGPVHHTQSTMIISEKDTSLEHIKSPSSSIGSEKHDDKEPAARSRSSSIASDKHTEVDDKPDDKSRSPSIPDEKQSLPGAASEKPSVDHIADGGKEIGKLDDLSRKFSITTEKCSDHEAKELDKSRSPSITSEKPDEKVPILHSTSPGAVDDKKETSTDKIVDDKVEKKTSATVEECSSTIVTEVKHDEREPIDLSKTSAKSDDGLSDTNLSTKISSHDESVEHPKSTDTSHVTVDQSEKDISGSASLLERSSRSPSIASVHDSKLDEKDAVQALQKLAETIADKSEEAKHITQPPHDEKEIHDTPKDRSRSHSVFDAGEKTPLGRSRTASLFEDRIPEMSSIRDEGKTATQQSGSTFSYDESHETELAKDGSSRKSSLRDVPDDKKSSVCGDSRKSSLAKFEDAVSKRSSVAIPEDIAGQIAEDYNTTIDEISKVEEYILNNYIMKEEKITSGAVEKIVMLYSMPKAMILRLIEAIILKTEVPRDFVVDYPEYDGTCDSSVTSKDDHVDVIDISPAKRHDIESYIQEEFVTKKKKISSKVLDDMVTLKSVSRSVIIMIIEEIITKRKIPKAELLEHGVLDASPIIQETDSYGAKEQKRGLLHDKNLPSMSTEFDTSSHPSISSSDIRKEHESGISEQKRVQVETYVMEECVKKGKKITVLVLEQIMTKMSVSRSVLLDIIENIIVTRKMSRTTMVDDAIYDEVEIEPSKSPEPLSTKDRIVEFSGKSTPDPKSSGYSTPETRQYDDKFSKEISSFSTDYESPFHKAFVGGMTEIRTTHITTLSGKSTPDFGGRGETPESLSDSIMSSIQTKAEESVSSDKQPLHTSAQEFSGSLEQAPSISTTRVAMTTTSTTTSALSSAPEQRDYAMPVASDKATGEQVFSDELTEKLKRDTISVESKSHLDDMPDMAKGVCSDTLDEEPIVTTKITKREVISEEEPEIITRVIRREVIDDDDDQPEVVTRVIRREVIDDDDDQPEVVTRVIRREVIDDDDDQPEVVTRVIRREVIDDEEDDQPEIITRVIRKEVIGDEEDGHPEIITRVIRREVISDEADQPEVITRIIRREVFTDEQEKPEVSVSEKSEIQTTPEKVTSAISADIKRTITTVTTVTEPDGKVTTKKDVQESTDTLEGDELLEKLIDSTKRDDSDTLTDAKSIESLKTEKIITETIKTVAATSGSGIRGDISSGTSTPDSTQRDEKSDTLGKSKLEKIVAETVDHPLSPLIKDLISDERSYSGKSSPEMLSKDIQMGSSTGKSTPDIPASPFTRDSGAGTLVQTSGRSTPDRRADSRSSTATPEGFRSSEVIRTTITTTRTMSEDGDIITTTKEITEATNEKGEVTILTEKTDVKVEDRIHSKDIGESSPKSDHSSMHSRAGTHAWGSSEDRHTYSDDDVPGSPLSTTSQVGYSPQSTYHFGEQTFSKDSSHKSIEFSEADMSSSFYGELPDLPPRVTTLKSAYLESGGSDTSGVSGHAPTEGDFSFKKFTVEKEFAGGYSEKSGGKRYVDDADLDFEKALMERKEMKRERDDHSSTASGYTNGNLTKPSSSALGEESKDAKDDSKKDPLAGWGTPLGLPSPKPPRKFNLRTTARPTDSADISPDSLNFDAINDWGEPLRLPSPAPIADEASNKGTPVTPKKERKQPKKVISENIKNKKRSDSPSKNEKKTKEAKNKIQPVYMDLTYVPHHGNSYYTSLEFFKRVRARYYVFSGTEPSREVYDALLDAKKTWEDKDLEVTMIPTYDTDTLGYWVADNEEALAVNHIDLSPSASRCTINLQDHETSCSAYRLEF